MIFRKHFFYALLMLAIHVSTAQVRLKIDIAVLNMDDNTPIDSCPIVMVTDAGEVLQMKTDAWGYLHYSNYMTLFKKAELYTLTTKYLKTASAQCGFLATDDRLKIDLTEKKEDDFVQYSHFFYLKPVSGCWPPMPRFIFKRNSVEFDTAYNDVSSGAYPDSVSVYPDHLAANLVTLLKDNPTIVIELTAHASSDEKLADQLSRIRGEKVKALLMQQGVNGKRLIVKGYGTKKLKITDTQIKKAKTKEEKEAKHAINRRCVFKIISWDFKG